PAPATCAPMLRAELTRGVSPNQMVSTLARTPDSAVRASCWQRTTRSPVLCASTARAIVSAANAVTSAPTQRDALTTRDSSERPRVPDYADDRERPDDDQHDRADQRARDGISESVVNQSFVRKLYPLVPQSAHEREVIRDPDDEHHDAQGHQGTAEPSRGFVSGAQHLGVHQV